MSSVNLLPARRWLALRRQQRLRTWFSLCAAYTLLLAAVYGYCFLAWNANAHTDLDSRLQNVSQNLQANRRQLASLRPTVQQARARLAANRAVVNQPDWSVLLSLISHTLNDRIALTQCHLSPIIPRSGSQSARTSSSENNQSSSSDNSHKRFRVLISGHAQSQQAVSDFLLALEHTRLFDSITLLRTRRADFARHNVVSFEIEGLIDGRSATYEQ